MIYKIVFRILVCVLPFPLYAQQTTQSKALKRFKVEQARQAVAVDDIYFYVINNSSIARHKKSDGSFSAKWDGADLGIKHLNSGVVIEGKLYCANSNFPDHPMISSVEIFDVKLMKHIGTHSFGISTHGSITWIDQYDGHWWLGFAEYSGKHASEGRDNRWTTVVKYSKDWQQMGAWVFPPAITANFGTMSNSGGTWSNEGLLFCTGHDEQELYIMQIPAIGSTLKHVKTIPMASYGQGIAIDKSLKNRTVLYGISRKDAEVIVEELP